MWLLVGVKLKQILNYLMAERVKPHYKCIGLEHIARDWVDRKKRSVGY